MGLGRRGLILPLHLTFRASYKPSLDWTFVSHDNKHRRAVASSYKWDGLTVSTSGERSGCPTAMSGIGHTIYSVTRLPRFPDLFASRSRV